MRASWLLLIVVGLGLLAWLLWHDAPAVERPGLTGDSSSSEGAPEQPGPSDAARLAARPVPKDTPSSTTPAPSPVPFGLTGRVLARGRRPAAGIKVVLRIDGLGQARGTTADDGTFRLVPQALPDEPWCSYAVIATDGQGRAATQNGSLRKGRTEDLRLRTLVLGESHALTVQVRASGAVVTGATVELWGDVAQRHGMLKRATTDAAGHATADCLPPELISVLAYAAGYAPTQALVSLPRPLDGPLVLILEPERSVEVRVVEGDARRPVAGVELVVYRIARAGRGQFTSRHRPRLNIPPTDAEGRTSVAHLGRDPSLHLGVSARGYATVQGRRVFGTTRVTHKPLLAIPVDEDTLTVVLAAARTIAWPIEDGEAPTPADGTAVALIEDPTAWAPFLYEQARIEGGQLLVDGAAKGAFRALARLPDGSLARLEGTAESTRGAAIAFRRPRTVQVTALGAERTPVPDLAIWVKGSRGEPLAPAGRTGADGVARVTGLYGGTGYVSIHSPAHAVGKVDLDAGDAQFEVLLDLPSGARPRLRLHLTLDGKTALPDRYSVYCERGHVRVLEEHPEEGVLDLEWTPKPKSTHDRITVRARDFVKTEASFTTETEALRVDLVSAGSLSIRVLHALDQRAYPQLDRADPTTGAWTQVTLNVSGMRALEAPEVGSLYPLHSLPPGRYRARLRKPLRTSSAAIVAAGQPTPILELDARGAGTIKGTIEAPQGTNLDLAYVTVSDAARVGQTRSIDVDAHGRFELPWPETVRVTMTAHHPLLRAHATAGSQTLLEPRGDVRLRLIATPRLSFLLDGGREGQRPLRLASSPRVVMTRTGNGPAEVLRLRGHAEVQADGSTLVQVAAYDAGRWSLWMDASPLRAPLRLEGLELGELDEDLDRFKLTPGSAITLKLRTKGEAAPELVMVTAVHEGQPRYERRAFAEGAKEVTIRGLGPGRFHLRGGRVTPADEPLTEIDLVVEVDGLTNVERTLGLR